MRFIPYLRYFWYITWHWDPFIALFTIYHEVRGEKKYHIHTMGEDELISLKEKGVDISHASIYMPLNYYVLEKLMEEIIKYDGNKTFLDIGCGKGRAMIVAAAYGFDRVWGVDFSKDFCEEAETITTLYARANPGTHFTVIQADASAYDIPEEISTIFLFNPFDEVMMWLVVSRIVQSQENHPRCIRILYANPQHKSVFLDFGFTEIFRLNKWNFFEAVILQKAS
ncbi:MAG: class I SAM-dependent methyltransferase [Bacteroidota bacterium]|nr:class I SAM-dependent methyltransferase [Bacteroidota bacterium]MDP4212534.1 class I SAM-dependent methyltransferase [Bacteroidota bacterium]MDP4250508.1 class I SAM-dependent methyltransferase [Bacteroidota bacterium]